MLRSEKIPMTKYIQWIFESVLVLVCVLGPSALFAQDTTLVVDLRHRPPEMIVEGEQYSGPLLDILEEAAQKAGYQIKYQVRQFQGSLEYLKRGEIDVLPRTIYTQRRAEVIDYLGPIGYERKEILFLVKQGKEASIQRFEDLKRLTVGVKRGTVYFEEFDQSQEINKVVSHDDENLVRMFAHNRFETMIILDKSAVEFALKKYRISDYAYAHYRHPICIGLYYGITRGHPAKDALQHALEDLVTSGRVNAIYHKYDLEPPFSDAQPESKP
jgi:polar amino acid transport system substrate-binding protein